MKIYSVNAVNVNNINYNKNTKNAKNAKNNINFGSCIPIEIYARTIDGEFAQVTNREDLAYCGQTITRHLNQTIGKKDRKLIKDFFEHDADYYNKPYVTTFITNDNQLYLLTGKDAQYVRSLGKDLGLAKRNGLKGSFEEKNSKARYRLLSNRIINGEFSPIKTKDGEDAKLKAIFDTKYDELYRVKGFAYCQANIVPILKEETF